MRVFTVPSSAPFLRTLIAALVEAKAPADFVDARKPRPDLRRVEVREIEINVWMLRAIHAADYSLGDHVARG